jgi:predicted ribosome quality control (RQC) complex YloA/Tae2 family protein
MRDVRVLKIGRHFRFGSSKIIVGRNEAENTLLLDLKNTEDYVFEVPDYGSPITILGGEKSKEAIEVAAKLTARYSDAGAKGEVLVDIKYEDKEQKETRTKSIVVSPSDENEVVRLRV